MPELHPPQSVIDDLTLLKAGLIDGPVPEAEGVDLVDEEGAPLVIPDLQPRGSSAADEGGGVSRPVTLIGHLRDRRATLANLGDDVIALPIRPEDPRLSDVLERLGNPEVVPESPKPSGGTVILLTGLSGSGKSTIARALMASFDQDGRVYTSLDGDVVRRHLSAGLGFSKEDRETNIRRIGWVAAEIARNGGIAVCSPIAPFDATRKDVRRMVEEAGGRFLLVHVATSLEECERRDRKGLYARARAGEIPEFTGISSPYEQPADADLVIDTVDVPVPDAVEQIRAALGLETRRQARPLKVLFVCTANICRSPSMELTARWMGLDGLQFDSAGVQGFPAQQIDEEMANALAEQAATEAHRSEISAFRSKPLTRALLEDADLVLTAESAHRTYILGDHPQLFRKVLTLGQAAASIERLRQSQPGLSRDEVLSSLANHRGSAGPESDVKDPYRQGPEAARACADQITRLLGTVLSALA